MLRARTRSVCIRVSEEELQKLQEACERSGSKTISELAREAMHVIAHSHESTQLQGRNTKFWLQELQSRLASLQSEVDRIAALPHIAGQ